MRCAFVPRRRTHAARGGVAESLRREETAGQVAKRARRAAPTPRFAAPLPAGNPMGCRGWWRVSGCPVDNPRIEAKIGAEMSSMLDRLLPPQALRWGRLTRESDQWLADAVRWQLANIPATLTRPCPAFSRLDSLMGNGGKVEADAWVPGQLDGWWRA